jgi:hypothetical protein
MQSLNDSFLGFDYSTVNCSRLLPVRKLAQIVPEAYACPWRQHDLIASFRDGD